ncbi:hypothetical protein JOF56_003008 [Kibdelosporangium banguiense]|uniref:Effector-associated domain-containing protein n=1 Tax=Kibdelosporangium banguiense TaxID=1365924 RepID=A0ABS4TDX3_9PSEU|nr:hypothetical protein [Kibdelosporangium banguiense]MBP2322623.1 hypothetical protein [Kibdelosporangium banguiense]
MTEYDNIDNLRDEADTEAYGRIVQDFSGLLDIEAGLSETVALAQQQLVRDDVASTIAIEAGLSAALRAMEARKPPAKRLPVEGIRTTQEGSASSIVQRAFVDAATTDEHSPEQILEGRRMSIVLVQMSEADRAAGWTSADLLLARRNLYGVLEYAFNEAAVPWLQCERYDRGDGLLVLVPEAITMTRLVSRLPHLVLAGLHAYNEHRQQTRGMRLHMAVHAGKLHYDEHGPASEALLHVFRLLDRRGALAVTHLSSPLVVVASEWFYANVIIHSQSANPDAYQSRGAKNGWIRAMGDEMSDVPRDRLTEVLLGVDPASQDGLMTFVDALLAIPVVGDTSSRIMLLESLRPEIADSVPYSVDARYHVLALVVTCMRYHNGLGELLAMIRNLEGRSMPVRKLDETIAQLVTTGSTIGEGS